MVRDDIQNDNKKAQNIQNMGGVLQTTQSLIILLVFTLFKSHHAKVPKNKTGQALSLALIVAVTDGQTHHHTSVISTSSIFSAGLRWFCVGGGGAART